MSIELLFTAAGVLLGLLLYRKMVATAFVLMRESSEGGSQAIHLNCVRSHLLCITWRLQERTLMRVSLLGKVTIASAVDDNHKIYTFRVIHNVSLEQSRTTEAALISTGQLGSPTSKTPSARVRSMRKHCGFN